MGIFLNLSKVNFPPFNNRYVDFQYMNPRTNWGLMKVLIKVFFKSNNSLYHNVYLPGHDATVIFSSISSLPVLNNSAIQRLCCSGFFHVDKLTVVRNTGKRKSVQTALQTQFLQRKNPLQFFNSQFGVK